MEVEMVERLKKVRDEAHGLFTFHPDGTRHVPADMLIRLINALLDEPDTKFS